MPLSVLKVFIVISFHFRWFPRDSISHDNDPEIENVLAGLVVISIFGQYFHKLLIDMDTRKTGLKCTYEAVKSVRRSYSTRNVNGVDPRRRLKLDQVFQDAFINDEEKVVRYKPYRRQGTPSRKVDLAIELGIRGVKGTSVFSKQKLCEEAHRIYPRLDDNVKEDFEELFTAVCGGKALPHNDKEFTVKFAIYNKKDLQQILEHMNIQVRPGAPKAELCGTADENYNRLSKNDQKIIDQVCVKILARKHTSRGPDVKPSTKGKGASILKKESKYP
jgi:hypothetical protein